MYVSYCKNKPDSTQLILEHAGAYFDVSYSLVPILPCGDWFYNTEVSPTLTWVPLLRCASSPCLASQEIQQRHRLANSISSYLIKPVQRITKYQLLLKVQLEVKCMETACSVEQVQKLVKMLFASVSRRSCWHAARREKVRSRTDWKWCSASQRKPTTPCTCLCWRVRPQAARRCFCTAADASKPFVPSSSCNILGFDGNIDSQGELILQESFQVWDPKTLIRKGRDRHLFLFEMSLVFSKEVKDSNGRSKYLYKSKLFVSDQTLVFVPLSWLKSQSMNIKTPKYEKRA